jgi:anti-sigma-K factor RskA
MFHYDEQGNKVRAENYSQPSQPFKFNNVREGYSDDKKIPVWVWVLVALAIVCVVALVGYKMYKNRKHSVEQRFGFRFY